MKEPGAGGWEKVLPSRDIKTGGGGGGGRNLSNIRFFSTGNSINFYTTVY